MIDQRRLVFVSTRFLYPVDSGGKIRTTQILRGLRNSEFRVQLVCPATPQELATYADEIDTVCDGIRTWRPQYRGRFFHYSRIRHIGSAMPIPIRTDVSQAARRLIDEVVNDQADIVVFDFLHATVLMPERMTAATLLFTHNVEAEIFRRHLDVASNPFARALWSNQLRKMEAFEKSSVHRYDGVVAVSERDAEIFSENYGYKGTLIIPTGVDLEFFSYAAPARSDDIVFCGSMDWLANQEAMQFFLDEVWDAIVAECPTARMTVVGRSPPPRLIAAARQRGVEWTFTGFVDDVRPYMQGAAVSVIPPESRRRDAPEGVRVNGNGVPGGIDDCRYGGPSGNAGRTF